jgi:hypothetical protein
MMSAKPSDREKSKDYVTELLSHEDLGAQFT